MADVAVVIPVRDRRALLRRCLDGLGAQTHPSFEVIVVDDGSTDGSEAEVLADVAAGRPVRLVRNPGRGAVAARRAGVEATEAPVVAFTDSDCVPQPGWLAAITAAVEKGADVVTGLTRPEHPAGPLEHTMASGEEGLFPTCNIAYRRAAFEEAGGFDKRAGGRFGFRRGTTQHDLGFGEDTLLGWRVARAGRWTFARDAVVVHHTFASEWRDTLRRTWMMRAFPALYRECPELRATTLTTQGIQVGRRTRAPMYAAFTAAVMGRRRTATVAAAAWIGYGLLSLRGRPGTRADRLRQLPIELALDVVTGAALVSGSARHRTVVL